MPPQFFLTQPAIQDIEAIADYIAGQTGLQQAECFLSKLDAKFARITQFPNLGRPRDEIPQNCAASQWRATLSSTPQPNLE